MGAALLAATLAALLLPISPAPQLAPTSTPATTADHDHDGVDDTLEAALLARFRPTFLVSAADCDARPARFSGGSGGPRALDKDGTIYGQVFPRADSGNGATLLEIHYYHLWSRDCGSHGHPLDAEHVAAVVEAPAPGLPAEAWHARAWYAAAHENTVCDVSRWARAAVVDAIDHGPTIWISAGKHASYFTAEMCGGGCGQDRCERMAPLPASSLVNLGEPEAPLNGASWAASPQWPLPKKMTSDFPDAVFQRLQQDGVMEARSPTLRNVQGAIAGSGATADSIAMAGRKADAALATADRHTDRGLDTSAAKTGRALKRAVRATGRFLGLGKP